jgi:hypothetical protein
MTVNDKKSGDGSIFVRLLMVTFIAGIVAVGLGFFTSYLADVVHAAPEKSMKEVISALGVLVFGIFTAATAGGALTAFGIMMTDLANPKILKD